MRFCLFVFIIIIIYILHYGSADVTLALTSALTTNQIQYGYNITIGCLVTPNTPVYNLNISVANSTSSWLAIDSISLSPWRGFTAKLGHLSQSKAVSFIGKLVIPARRAASYSIVVNANWTDASGTILGSLSTTSNITLTHSSNVPPIITQIKPVVTVENSAVSLLPNFNITDNDFYLESDEGIMTVTLSVLNSLSSLSLDPLIALSHGATISVSKSNRISYQCGLNCALSTFGEVQFVPATDWFGIASLNLTMDDNFNGGVGGSHITQKLFDVTVKSLNQAPSLNAPSTALTVVENCALQLNNISFYDVDATASENFTLRLTANYGRFTYSTLHATNASFSSHSLIVYGLYSVVSSSALNSIYYYPPTNWITTEQGLDTITIVVTDGYQASQSASVFVNVARFDKAPVLVLSNSFSVYENSNLAIPISINDTHSGLGRQYFVGLTVSNGLFSLTSLLGLEPVVNQTNFLQFFASSSDANTAMNPIIYTPNTNFNGHDLLIMSVQNDIGLWTNKSVAITVLAVNDAPQIHVSPAPPLTGSQGSDIQFNITVVDVDDENVTVSLSSLYGTFLFSSFHDLNITGNTLSGRQSRVSTALSPVTFISYPLVFGMNCSLFVQANDIHNAASYLTIPVYLAHQNTPPSIVVPSFVQDSTVNATFITSISVSDYEDDDLYLSFKATNGSISLSSKEGLRFFTGSGVSDKNVIVLGKSMSLNNALYNMKFIPDPFFIGNATVTFWLNDTTYAVGPRIIPVIVTQTKTPPDITCPELLLAVENQVTNLGSLRIVDSSAINPMMNFTASVSSGSFQLNSLPSRLFMSGNATGSLLLYGPYVQVNQALSQLQYQGNKYFDSFCCGPVSIVYNTTRGRSSSMCATDVIVNSINDLPVISTCQILPATLGVPSSLASCINIKNADAGESIYSRYKLLLQAVDGSFQYDFVEIAGSSISIVSSGLNYLFLIGPINQLSAALNQGFVTYNGSANRPSADLISIVLTDVTANVNVTSSIPVALLHNPVQVTLTEGFYRMTSEDTSMTINVTVFGVNSLESLIKLTITSSIPQSRLDLLSAKNVSIAMRPSSNNITLQIPVTKVFQNITLGYTPAPNWNSAFNPDEVILFQIDNKQHARIDVTVTAVNDAPSISMLAAFNAVEDAPFTMNVTVADVDVNEAPEPYLFVSVYNFPATGMLTLGSYLGLQTSLVSNTRIDFNGSLVSVNEALQTLQLVFPSYHGNVTTYVHVSDNGFSGIGGVKWANVSSLITISHVNHPPTLTLNNLTSPILIIEDITSFLNFTLKDPDDNTNVIFTAMLDGGSYLNAVISKGFNVLSGSFGVVSKALQNVTISPKSNWNGFGASLSINVSDSQAHTIQSYSILVLPDADPPVLYLNCSSVASVNEHHDIYLPPLSLIQDITDPDYNVSQDADTLFRLSLSVFNGTISVVEGDISFFYGTSDFLLHKSSLPSLALRYQPLYYFNGRDSLRIVLNDTTGTPVDIHSCPISVIAVEDPVVISFKDTVSVAAHTATNIFSNVTISRVPYASNSLLFCNVTFLYGVASTTIPSSTNVSKIQDNLQKLVYSSALNSGDEDLATITIGNQNSPLTYSTAEIDIMIF